MPDAASHDAAPESFGRPRRHWPCMGIDMTTEERLDKIERDIEVLRQEVRDLLERFLKYVQDVEEDPVRD